jgi:hypothetical protein
MAGVCGGVGVSDNSIRVLFWQPNKIRAVDKDFGDCLSTISGLDGLVDYKECSGGARLRVDRLTQSSMAWEGDFVRQQVTNLPPLAPPSQPLVPNPNPIGHRAAFLYCLELNVLAIQASRPGVSAQLVNSYIRNMIHGHMGFHMDPCLSKRALERIRDGAAKGVVVRVARPSDLTAVDPENRSLERSLTQLQTFVDGQQVEFTVLSEPRNRDSSLNKAGLQKLIRWATGNRGHVKGCKVQLHDESEAIDVFAERIDKSGSISLDSNDLDAAYMQRMHFIKEAYAERRQEISETYGAPR